MTKEPKVFPMMKHTELINVVAEKLKAEWYLEIGVYNPEHNFDRIKVDNKYGVDPDKTVNATHQMTSDDFFEAGKELDKIMGDFYKKYDIIFLDGLHHADQLRKDIINAWQCLDIGGVIIIHDSSPPTEKTTCVPRGAQREWCGDIYKTVFQIENEKFTLNDDYGVTVIRKTGELKMNDGVTNWEEFDMFRDEILDLKSWDECVKIIDSWK